MVGVYLEFRVIPVLLWSFSAVALGTGLAGRSGDVRLVWFAAAVGIGWLLQGVLAHSVNEVTDWRSGTDRDPAPRVLSGGSKVVRAGLLSERELVWAGAVAGAAAVGLGLWVAEARGWWLLGFGAVGVVGAVAYTLPPVALAYSPFAGEAVAFVCVLACTLGGFAVQRGSLDGSVLLVGATHAAYCVSMLMLHHYLDRGPDARAHPPKVTTVVRLGAGARSYATAWAAAALGLACACVLVVGVRLVPLAVASLVAVLLQLRVLPDDPASVTRAEAWVIGLGIAGALTSAALLAWQLAWVLLVPVLLVPLELLVGRDWLAPALARSSGAPPGRSPLP